MSVRIDRMMAETLASATPSLRHAVDTILAHPGKRLRPLLMGILASAYGPITDRVVTGGTFVEMIHVATLIHDDVIDESDVRRGAKSIRALHGNRRAVLMGDFILSKAIMLAVDTLDPEVIRIISRVGAALTEGEVMQDDAAQLADVSEERYFEIIRRKTASLLMASAVLGALLAGETDSEVLGRISDATLSLGTAFQIRDDIFDYLPTPGLGKPAGNDLREHKVTLPLIHALSEKGRRSERARHLLRREQLTDDEIGRLTRFAIDSGGIDYAEEQMRRLLEEAKARYAEAVPPGRSRDLLFGLCDYIAERDR